MSTIKDLVENPHRVYKKYFNYWTFLLETYEGGKDYIGDQYVTNQQVRVDGKALDLTSKTHLFKHKKERDVDFRERVKMSYYYNFAAPIIDIYTNHLFKKPIIEDWGSIEKLVDFRKDNIDRQDGSIAEFRKELADLSQIFGHVFVVVDKPNPGVEIRTLQDQIDNKLFPYFTIFHPTDIINWSLDPFGKPYWVLVKEVRDANQDPFNFDSDMTSQVNFRLWTRQEWILYASDFIEIRRDIHGLGRVPITSFVNKKSKKYKSFLGISAIADIAYIARDLFNACSELKQILRDQTFAILTLQGTADEYNEITVGTSKGLIYPPDRNAPGFISPPSANAEVMFKHIDRQISAMFRLAKLEGGSAQFQGQSAMEQSGVSKAWDFNETNQALSDKADNLQDGEMKLWRLFALWEGKEFDGSIIYPKEFSVQSLNEDLDEAEKALKLNISRQFDVEIKKAIIKKKFPRLPDKDIDKMIKEVEENEGKTKGGSLAERLIEQATKNAQPGGGKGGNANV